MNTKANQLFLSYILIFIAFFSLVLGFYFDENSAGAGSYNGDIENVWRNINVFLNNNLNSSINHKDYITSRTPFIYIIHEIFNPFLENIVFYRRSVFVVSLTLPLLFFFCLREKFTKEESVLLLLISSTICLSPYYRTSSFWGLEENFGLIFVLLTYLSLNKFLNNTKINGYKNHLLLFLISIFSSCCLYFDQKLIIIPIICFLKIILSNKFLKFKILSAIYYLILSLPYIYLILLWGGLIPSGLLEGRKLGNEIFFHHIGYSSTIIAFYLFPLLLFKEKNILNLIKSFFLNKKNYYYIILSLVYICFLVLFHDFEKQSTEGKGIIHKISIMLFDSNTSKMIFVYFSFFLSWIIILIYIGNKLNDALIIVYFFILTTFSWPMFQEYFDPLILLLAFTFFTTKIYINYKNSITLFIYLLIFLTGANVYYLRILNLN